MNETTPQAVANYLDAVSLHLGPHPDRQELLENLENDIYDHLADQGAALDDDAAVARVIASMDPPKQWAAQAPDTPPIPAPPAPPAPAKKQGAPIWTTICLVAAGISLVLPIAGALLGGMATGVVVLLWIALLALAIVSAVVARKTLTTIVAISMVVLQIPVVLISLWIGFQMRVFERFERNADQIEGEAFRHFDEIREMQDTEFRPVVPRPLIERTDLFRRTD